MTGAGSTLAEAFSGAGGAITDRDVLAGYGRDQSPPRFVDAGTPAVLVRPRDTAEVRSAVIEAGRLGLPVVVRGAGSGLAGGANAIHGCLVLCLERMTDIVSIDGASLTATVQAGVINDDLRRAAAEHGLWYAPDPASAEFSTIGGNVATNAGGLCCVKYGVTRDWVLGLEVVMADGEIVRVGRRTRKGVAGYDLAALFCGSEGTLGVVTEVTVRLQPLPPSAVTVAASFAGLEDAGSAVRQVMAELTPSLLEIMDAATIAAVEAFQPMELDREAAAMVFARSDAPGDGARVEAERIAEVFTAAGASIAVVSDDAAEGRALLAARKLAYPALERLGSTMLDDVAVPLGEVPRFLREAADLGARSDLRIAVFGHAGDGNMHPTIVYDADDAEETRRAVSAFEELLDLARRLGGTIAGEHGIGTLKRVQLSAELGPSRSVHLAIKDALDPTGLFNPGRAI